MKEEKEYLQKLRHSAAHLLAAAVLEIYPDAKPTIGPAIEDGFYYDFEFQTAISEHDLGKIEKRMHKIALTWKDFSHEEVSAKVALEKYSENEYKQELIRDLEKEGAVITLYTSGKFTDLCRGGHLDAPAKELKHFKLMSVAGAYWRGDEKNKMLTRIYGTAFSSAEELDEYLKQQEQAKLRDHRKLGKELDLYHIDDMVGKGLILWLPKGTILRDEIENLVKEKEAVAGYVRVATPHIAKEELYLTSGHLPYYKDSMYPPMQMDDGVYYLKAMNCPHHHRIYGFKPRSYRELPLRMAEYGTCYRNELSGALAGLLRVRGMAMNDAHIYCTKEQIRDEFAAVISLTQDYFKIFGLSNYWFRLSKWDPAHTEKYINEPENWKFSEQVLREVLDEMKVEYEEVDDEAAFYGPKVDVQFHSTIGREETMSTIQLDFMAKKRFGLEYVDESGEKNGEVFVIHRAPLSVHERFLAFLIEHYAGAFPVWLSPVQVKVLPITDSHLGYAKEVLASLKSAGIRAELDDRSERLQAKIRDAQLEKVPYMLVVGDKEMADKSVAVRKREGGKQEVVGLEEFVVELREEIVKRV
ncbi:MAG: threonine--tRNA ligase [Candidatus Pacebacteria bacterium CG_4_10_14_0_8_um_filter_42_14]|nr:MAG: threonine--tRNA ligase [Candidatus Pacebacteria bacterium CG_4_10_14_0_8_um_filter_42_14]